MKAALRQVTIIAVGVALGLLLGGLAWRGLWAETGGYGDDAALHSQRV